VKNKPSRERKSRVLVIGDVMLDHYVHGHARRISPEAPVPVVEFQNEKYVPGGAANVAANLASLGVDVDLFGAIGDDNHGGVLLRLLVERGIGCDRVKEYKDRITTVKQRIMCGQQIVRVDRETHRRLTEAEAKSMVVSIRHRMDGCEGVIFSDYGKGVVTQHIVEQVIKDASKQEIPVMMNIKPGHPITPHKPFSIQVNRREAFELAMTFDDGSWSRLREAAANLAIRYEPENVIITLGGGGIYLYRTCGMEPKHLPTEAIEVIDVSGAGDTVLAAFAAQIVKTGGMVETALAFANKCAAKVVAKHGTATVSLDEI
jgi:rfaE bifunctional protein kinase chain/domain